MASTIPVAFVEQYKANIMMLAQQKGSKLRRTVRAEDITGRTAYFERLADTSMLPVTSRYMDTPNVEPVHSRRAYSVADWAWAAMLDRFDAIRYIIDPKSEYVRAASWAAGRQMDDILITASTADAKEGQSGGTTVPFPAGQKLGTASDISMDIDTLLDIKYLFDAADIDPDMSKYLLVSPKQVSSLLDQTEVKNSDYNTVKALAMGQINTFMGFDFIMTNRLELDSNDKRHCLAYTADALRLGIGKDMKVEIDKRSDKMNNWQVLVTMSIGAVRTEDVQVVEALIKE